jgi:hypothetical protein
MPRVIKLLAWQTQLMEKISYHIASAIKRLFLTRQNFATKSEFRFFCVSFERQTECEHQIRMDKLQIYSKLQNCGEQKIR